MSREKIQGVDILRGIGILAVIAIHITATCFSYPINTKTYLIYGILNKFCNFAVPLFLFISALLLIKNTKEAENFSVKDFYLRRGMKILIPYFIWTIIYLVYLRYIGAFTGITSITQFVAFFCLGKTYYHLYFIPIIIQLYLLFPVIWFLVKERNNRIPKWIEFIIAFLVLEGLQYTFLSINIKYIYPHFQNSAVIVFSYILPIGMGLWIGYNWDSWKKFNLVTKTMIALAALVTGYCFIRRQLFNDWDVTLSTMPMLYMTLASMLLLIFSEWLSKGESFLKKILLKISKESFFIYLAHPLILSIITINIKWTETALTKSAFINYTIDFFLKYIVVLGVAYTLSKLQQCCCNIKKSMIK